jgi:hypothetical protein
MPNQQGTLRPFTQKITKFKQPNITKTKPKKKRKEKRIRGVKPPEAKCFLLKATTRKP